MDENKEENSIDEVVIEEDENLDDSVVAEENSLQTIKKLREKLKSCEKEKQEFLAGWQRAKADLINARKRDEEEHKNFIKFANERLIEDIVPVINSFHMAFENKEQWEKVDKNWRIGVEYIYSQLVSILEKSGVKLIEPKPNTVFDPNEHESVGIAEVKDRNLEHKVVEVVQRGYSLNGKILQPAKVKIGEYKK